MSSPIEMVDNLILHMHNKRKFNYCDILTVMVLTRQILEMRGLKRKSGFDLLNFYCSWCVHYELTRANHCVQILEEIRYLNPTLCRN